MKYDFNKKLSLFFCLCLFVLIASSCCPTTSLHPLSDPENPVYDERLIGVWRASIDDCDVYLHIGKGKNSYTVIHTVEHKNDGTMNIDENLTTFPTLIDGDTFLNIHLDLLFEGWDKAASGYIFLMYNISDTNQLSLFLWDEKMIEDAILQGKIKGELSEKQTDLDGVNGNKFSGKAKCVMITDDPDNIIQFIKLSGAKNVFNQYFGTYERIDRKTIQSSNSVDPVQAPCR